MNNHMFQCNEDLVKANCTLQDWQDYLHSFNDCGLSMPVTNSFVAPNVTAVANLGPNYCSPKSNIFSSDMLLSTKSVLLEGLALNEGQGVQTDNADVAEDKFDMDFTFEMQDFDSCEKAALPGNTEENYVSSCKSDFGINFDDLAEEQNNSVEKSQTDAEETEEKQTKSNSKSKQVRWRKGDDKDLFCELTKMLRIHSLTIEQFLNITKSGINNSLVDLLIEKVNWKGTSVALIDRICKLNKKERSLSYRDFKQLRKMYYQQLRNQHVDWDYLLFQFPGRNMDYVKEVCHSFPRRESILEKTSTHSN